MSKTSNKFCVEEDNSAEEETLQKNIKVEHEDIFRKLHKKYSETAQNTKIFINISRSYCTCKRRRNFIRARRRRNRRNHLHTFNTCKKFQNCSSKILIP